jgi:two-component system chemotaxis response regulator CheV
LLPPPVITGRDHVLTAITHIEQQIVEIIDIEKVLAGVMTYDSQLPAGIADADLYTKSEGIEVLLVDDSKVALDRRAGSFSSWG